MSDWIDDLARLRERSEPAIVVTVASTKGSVPRGPGTKMIVTDTDVYGTIGGGHLELQAIGIARDQLKARSSAGDGLHRFPLGASLGQCCGGLVNLLFEPVAAAAGWVETLTELVREGRNAIVISAIHGETSEGKLVVSETGRFGTLSAASLDGDAERL